MPPMFPQDSRSAARCVDRRIGHDEVTVAPEWISIPQAMHIFVKRVRLADVTFQPVDGEVHLREADRGLRLLLAKERNPVGSVEAKMLDEMARLDEHAARAARRVEHDAAV